MSGPIPMDISGKLNLNNWYKYLLYIFGITLVLSFFLEAKGIELSKLRAFSINIIIATSVLWFIEDVFSALDKYYQEDNRTSEKTYEAIDISLTVIYLLAQIVTIILVAWWLLA